MHFYFYYPIPPPPSFRHIVAMWALQSGQFILNWQFSFDKQVNWPAAEANWALMVRGETSAQEWDIVRAAMFNSRSADPGGWAHDCYEDDDMERLLFKVVYVRTAFAAFSHGRADVRQM